MYKLLNKALLIFVCMQPVVVFAAADQQATEGFQLNPVVVGLVSLMLILLFVIGIAAHVLHQLTTVYREKTRKYRHKQKGPLPALIIFALLVSVPAIAAEGATSTPTYINGVAAREFYALISIIGLEILILFALLLNIRTLVKANFERPQPKKTITAAISKPFLDRFNQSVAVEKETDIILDHEYDGIRELDNDLPPWWKYGFYFTIVISVIYMWYYHAGGGPSSHDEYVAEITRAEAEVAAYLAATSGNIDETNVTPIDDQAELAGAIKIYQTACAACHANDGGGTIGPNLTDAYWMHGGSLSDIFKSIKYGFPEKGMKSWKDDYSPKQIAALATYIMQLHGTQPAAPKEPQGDLYQAVTSQTATEKTITEDIDK